MRAATAPIADLLVTLDTASAVPLYLQLYEELRSRILERTVIAPGMKLPSSRSLSMALALSRNTVVAAFEQLLAEGYLEGRGGSGTYVTRQLPEAYLTPRTKPAAAPPRPADAVELSARGRAICGIRFTTALDPARLFGEAKPAPFGVHVPALDQFPYAIWGKLLRRVWDQARPEMFDAPDPAGYRPLREAIAQYARAARAVNCDWRDVIVLPSTKTIYQLAASLLLDPGEAVLVEDPGYLSFIAAFHQAGQTLVPVPVDDEGFDAAAGARLGPQARMACVTPSHHHPLGVTMSLPRRIALLEWARRRPGWIIEDDYDSEFRYAGRPLASLQGLDDAGRVLYTGTFSKTLLPSLRIAYVIAPPAVAPSFRAARAHLDWSSPVLEQAVLAEFIREGHFARHVRRMRRLYRERRAALRAAALRHLGGLMDFPERHTGMHLLGWLPAGVCDLEAARAAAEAGVKVTPVSPYYLHASSRAGLLLGFAAYDERQIDAGMSRLAPVVAGLVRRRNTREAS